jgi:hypothetical protein
MDFLALNESEVAQFLTYFQRMDKERTGFITTNQIFEFVRTRRTVVADAVRNRVRVS